MKIIYFIDTHPHPETRIKYLKEEVLKKINS